MENGSEGNSFLLLLFVNCRVVYHILSSVSFVLSIASFLIAVFRFLDRVRVDVCHYLKLSSHGLWFALWTDVGFGFGMVGVLLQTHAFSGWVSENAKLGYPLMFCFILSLCIDICLPCSVVVSVYCGFHSYSQLLVRCLVLQVEVKWKR